MRLLSRPTNIEREVRAYAEQLLVTPKYLSAGFSRCQFLLQIRQETPWGKPYGIQEDYGWVVRRIGDFSDFSHHFHGIVFVNVFDGGEGMIHYIVIAQELARKFVREKNNIFTSCPLYLGTSDSP